MFTIIGFFLFLYATFSFSRSLRNKTSPRRPPPEAGCAWPVIGHLNLLGGSDLPHVALAKMADKYGPIFSLRIGADKYGPIFSLRIGVHPTLIVSSWEMAKECFTVNDLAFAGRPKLLASELLGYNCGMFGLYSHGPHYCHMRKIITQKVLSSHRLEKLKHMRESEVKLAVEDIYRRWAGENSQSSITMPVSCEMKKWFRDITFRVIFTVVVGKRFDEADENKTAALKAMADFFKMFGEFVISDALPYLRWLDLGGKGPGHEEDSKRVGPVSSVLGG